MTARRNPDRRGISLARSQPSFAYPDAFALVFAVRMAKRGGRKLLVASLGVAAVSYVACGSGGTVANLMAPPQDASADVPRDAFMDSVVANLLAPPDGFGVGDVKDAQSGEDGSAGGDGRDGGPTDRGSLFDVVANLVVPVP